MKNILIIVFIFMASIQAHETDKNKKNKVKFLDVKVENPDLQGKIDLLKKEYDVELATLKNRFNKKKKNLKKTYKGKLKELGVKPQKNPKKSKKSDINKSNN